MPTFGSGSPIDRDPRRWAQCRTVVAAGMVREGWHPKARKFLDVQNKRARRMFFT